MKIRCAYIIGIDLDQGLAFKRIVYRHYKTNRRTNSHEQEKLDISDGQPRQSPYYK
jgi:hypothetical protein